MIWEFGCERVLEMHRVDREFFGFDWQVQGSIERSKQLLARG
ncbi:hypothetical protein FHX08_005615 [Rhizobium sp. BK529]|nr:hypothetical protein [Rhizobium sp. BK529]